MATDSSTDGWAKNLRRGRRLSRPGGRDGTSDLPAAANHLSYREETVAVVSPGRSASLDHCERAGLSEEPIDT